MALLPVATASENDLFQTWGSGRDYWADELTFHPNGEVTGFYADDQWMRRMPTKGTWHFSPEQTKDGSTLFVLELNQEGAPDRVRLYEGTEGLELEVRAGKNIYRSYFPVNKLPKTKIHAPIKSRVYPVYPQYHQGQQEGQKRVIVLGAVAYPGLYYLDIDYTIAELIEFCGPDRMSDVRRVSARRMVDGAESVLTYDCTEETPENAVMVKDGDVFIVNGRML